MDRFSDKAIEIIDNLHTERLDYTSEYMPLIDAAMRLSDYEDSGFEPDRVTEIMNIVEGTSVDRLRKLVEAEKDGRCEILKFKPDTEIYRVWPAVGKRPPFMTAHYALDKNFCVEAQLWNNAYQTRAEAETELKKMQEAKTWK